MRALTRSKVFISLGSSSGFGFTFEKSEKDPIGYWETNSSLAEFVHSELVCEDRIL